MKVICICAQYAQGKDVIADFLAEKLTWHWQRIGFAHAVKQIFMDSFGVTWEFIEEWKRNPEPPPGFDKSIRQSLQFIGDGFRQIKSNIWVEIMFRTESPKLISDGRYLNEAKAVREHGGINVLLWRKGYENGDPNPSESQIKPTVDWFKESGLEGDVRNEDLPGETMTPRGIMHPSLFDFFIRNEGTIEELYKKVDNIIVPAIKNKYY